jgi:hypothetical protein
MYLDELSFDVKGVLIGTLTRFFNFALDFDPESQCIHKTTHTSSYTYWFLRLSAEILTKCSLSNEMQARHAYLLTVITTRLNEGKECYYLFLMASIYAANIISERSTIHSSPSGCKFLRAVTRYHGLNLKRDPTLKELELYSAVNANEVTWDHIDHALKALEPSDAAFVPNRDPTLGEERESGGLSRDRGESPSREWFMFN